MRDNAEGTIRVKHNNEIVLGVIQEFKMRSDDIMMNQDNTQDLLKAANYPLLANPQTNAGPGYFLNTSDHHRTVLHVIISARNTDLRTFWSSPDNVKLKRLDPRVIILWLGV